MARGRPPVPTKLKRARGNPGKRKLPKDEPEPLAEKGGPPKWFDKISRDEWNRIVDELRAHGLFTVFDRTALIMYCEHFSQWVKACLRVHEIDDPVHPASIEARLQAHLLHQLLANFGFTPVSRVRLAIPIDPGASRLQQFLEKHRAASN